MDVTIVISGIEVEECVAKYLELDEAWHGWFTKKRKEIENVHVVCDCGRHTNLGQLELIVDFKDV
jgi:hypothetical protein